MEKSSPLSLKMANRSSVGINCTVNDSLTHFGVIYFGSCQDQGAISGDGLSSGRAQRPSKYHTADIKNMTFNVVILCL